MGLAPIAGNGFDLANLDFDPPSAIGQLYIKGSSGLWTELTPGPVGSYLQSGGAGVIPGWSTPGGAGDMLASTYDPVGVAADAFDFANMGIASQADGDLLVLSAGTWSRLPASVAGRVLTSTGPTTPPTYQAPTGDMLKSTYDPTNVGGDAFDLSKMVIAGQTAGDIYTYTTNWVRKPLAATEGKVPVSGVSSWDWDEAPLAPGGVDGLRITRVSNSQLSIGAGVCRSEAGLHNIKTTASILIDLTVPGAGGLDTGSEAANTWYDVYIIDGASVAEDGLLVVSGNVPTMPPGYDRRRLLGTIPNDASSNIREFIQSGKGRDRWFHYTGTTTDRIPLSSGAATTPTAVSCIGQVPPTSSLMKAQFFQGSTTQVALLYYDVTTPTMDYVLPQDTRSRDWPLTPSRTFAYSHAGAGGALIVVVEAYKVEL